ncbi:MAG: PEP-CTERM sorting domain-containing protein, partial [Opitutales bacterium]|nr:PEP-CTERM sorting domain-containing protein [Opitutales bacterium]
MNKYITLAALLAAGTACAHAEIPKQYEEVTTDTTIDKGGDLYAGPFSFTFELAADATVSGEYDILLAYYQVNGSNYNVNAFELVKTDAGLTLELVRGGALSSTDLTNKVTMGKSDSSVFKANDADYVLSQAGTYTVDYLGGTNESAAADLYFGGVKVASFTGGSHNMNGAQQGGNTLNLVLNSSYSTTYLKPVPEPSAFGMLAGLGALALVAARRRRS